MGSRDQQPDEKPNISESTKDQQQEFSPLAAAGEQEELPAPEFRDLSEKDPLLYIETMVALSQPSASVDDPTPHWEELAGRWGEQLYAQNLPDMVHKMRMGVINSTGFSYFQRYQRQKHLSDLDRAIELWHGAIQTLPEGDSALPNQLNMLGIGFGQYYGATRESRYLEQAIEKLESALKLTATGAPTYVHILNNLGSFMRYRYDETRDIAHLDRAVHLYEQVAEHTSPDDQELPQHLHDYCIALTERYQKTHKLADLRRAIRVWAEMVDCTPHESPFRPIYLTDFAEGLMALYRHTHKLDDLERSIEIWRKATQEIPPTDKLSLPAHLHLIEALREKVRITRSLLGLKQLIEQLSLLLNEASPDLPDRSHYQSNLDQALSMLAAEMKAEEELHE